MRELNDARTMIVHFGDKAGARRQHGTLPILQPPTLLQLWRQSFGLIKVQRKYFCQLLDAQGPNGHNETLQQSMSKISVGYADFLQHPFICLVQGLGQFVKASTEAQWEAMLQHFQLTIYPPEPMT